MTVRRLFWLAAGATAGVLVVRRLTRTAQKLTPAGLGESVSSAATTIAESVRDFLDDVKANMAVREAELWEALQADDPAPTGTDDDADGGDGAFRAPGGVR